jgi:uncharacterized iron-regulated protein
MKYIFFSLCLLGLQQACTTAAPAHKHLHQTAQTELTEQTKLNNAVQSKPIVLLGEIHDNALQHRMRLIAFQALLDSGARPALLMEQFDQEAQRSIDAIRLKPQSTPSMDANAMIEAAGGAKAGWHWAFYKPFIELALQYKLPLIAVNVSNADAMKTIRGGLGSLGISAQPSQSLLDAQGVEVFDGHCKAMPLEMAKKMANAQIARDFKMAEYVERFHGASGAVLLAGNGHVRSDIGVPYWLSPESRAKSVAIGLQERGQALQPFDVLITTLAQARPDYCEAFKKDAR